MNSIPAAAKAPAIEDTPLVRLDFADFEFANGQRG
jgi:hypothetical protein